MSAASDLLAGALCGDDHRIVLVHHGREITLGEFRLEISDFAQGLAHHLQAGDLLAIDLPNGPAILALLLACFRTGIVPMPVSPALKWPELKQILDRARPKGLITHRTISGDQREALGACVRNVWLMQPADSPIPVPPGPPLPITTPSTDPERLALVLHTSGSTGLPKGVMLANRSLKHILQYRLDHCELGPDSVSVVASCVSQSVGLYQCLALLAAGAKIVLLDSYELEIMVEAVKQHSPSHLVMVVGAWDQLLHHPAINAHSLRRLRFASAGADQLTARVQRRSVALTGRSLRSSYGLTESSWAIINSSMEPGNALALGKPSPGVDIRLLNNEGDVVTPGAVGQIHIRSPRNLLGYLHDASATQAILNDGWLVTGDLARQDHDGVYWFVGRCKDMIVLSTGDNVSPAEVEAVLCTHPAVKACLVTGRRSSKGSL
ncbi:MAG TPA: class I adenylate-forming enzyme family protein, partial [Xanthomonadales bacterium]|nr:class I adenylate-forming enzyme family protein [Xanthomonadales bacterium]